MSESDQQITVVQWWNITYPKLAGCLISYPSGWIVDLEKKNGKWKPSGKDFAKLKKVKAEGWRKGVSDIFIAVPRKGKHGLWIEIKDTNKTWCKVSKEQREHLELMKEMGYEAIWCAGADVTIAAIKTYMSEE